MPIEPVKKHYNSEWLIWRNQDNTFSTDRIQIILLQEVRDELKALNELLHCPNFTGIPSYLKGIQRNTTKKKRKNNSA